MNNSSAVPLMPVPTDEMTRAHSATANADGLEAFVAEHYPRLIRLAGLICYQIDEAEDAVQAGLERAWRKRSTLKDPESMRPWLDRIVVNEAIRTRHRPGPTVIDLSPRAAGPAADEWLALRLAFARLSAEQRAVIVLHLYLGYSVVDTAALVGAPLETVRSRLRLARDRLRYLLAEEPDR